MLLSEHLVLFFTGCTVEASAAMNACSLPTLRRLAMTCRSLYATVQQYTEGRIEKRLALFGLDYDRVLRVLRSTESIILGSFVLACVAPALPEIQVDNIDFMVPTDHLHKFTRSVTVDTEYTLVSPQHLPIQYNRKVIGVVSYRFETSGKQLFLNFHVVNGYSNEFMLETLFYSATTLTMNAIMGWGIFCAYSDLLEQGMALRNDPTTMRRYNKVIAAETTDDFERDNIRQTKMEHRGFSFAAPNGSTHTFHQCLGSCANSYSCPDAIRSVRDAGSRFFALFDNAERRESGRRWIRNQELKITAFELPDTMWRLSNSIEYMPRKAAGRGFTATLQSGE